MSSTPPSLSLIKKILCESFAATRSASQLNSVFDFLTNETEIVHDPLWTLLPRSQRLLLCAYFRYCRVNEEALIHLKDPSNLESSVRMLILVKGTAELTCGTQVLPLDSQQGPCLGTIPIPASVQMLMNGGSPDGRIQRSAENIFLIFMQKVHEMNETCLESPRPCVQLHKGSHYIYLNCLDCQRFMESLFERMISHQILHRLHCHMSRKRNLELLTFPKDQPIMLEGMDYKKIMLIIRGKCQLKVSIDERQMKSEESKNSDEILKNTIHVSQVGPLSFLGFLPHFVDEVCEQPLSVVSLSKVRVLLLDARAFVQQISSYPAIFDTFQDLSRRQIEWLDKEVSKHLKETEVQQDEENHEEEEEETDFPSSSISDIEDLIKIRTKKNPRSSRHKLLREFKRLVIGEEQLEEVEEYEDLFLRFDFKDECMRELEQIIEKDCELNDSEDSDLAPYPSILLSRKLHGKTLPHVKQSRGYLNPLKNWKLC